MMKIKLGWQKFNFKEVLTTGTIWINLTQEQVLCWKFKQNEDCFDPSSPGIICNNSAFKTC